MDYYNFICKIAVFHCSYEEKVKKLTATIIYLEVSFCYLAHGSDVVCLIDEGTSHECFKIT